LVPSEFARQLERELNAANSKIELLMSANADVARIAAERDAAEKRVLHLEAALRKIADQDYRGPRSTESEIALRALEAKP
jgi:RNA polymerase-binding transcription factor DksA